MNLNEEILLSIESEAKRLGDRYHAYHNALELQAQRTKKRLRSVPAKQIKLPAEWQADPRFNPFHVFKNRKAIARAITKKILSGTYTPCDPYKRFVPKSGGGFRVISVYQVPDAAVSSHFYRKLLQKNIHRFSGYSYAYRSDRNAHFAIQDIAVDLAGVARTFVAEYDFSKFFDSIQHKYLHEQLNKNGFSVSERERDIISAFISGAGVGIPQGTSISLFLANLACWKLDKRLERAGLRFARYADDTVIWSSDYDKISRAPGFISEFSEEAGVQINVDKSAGIRVLCPTAMPCEFPSRTSYIEFLGYSVSSDSIGIKASSITKIKKHISYLLYQGLIQPLQGSALRAVEIPANDKDRDLVATLSAIRRYLYGNLSEDFIWRFLAGSSGRLFYKGVMSFYPLLSDKVQMTRLDGWLVNQVWKAVRLRLKLLHKWGYSRSHSFPFNVARKDFVETLRERKVYGRRLYAIPSFVIVYLALRKAVSEGGVQQMLAREEY